MKYRVKIAKKAKRELAALPKRDQARIIRKAEALSENPRPRGSKDMKGELKGYRRIQVGDYRVIYLIRNKELIVVVVRVGHRKDVYRNLESLRK